MELAAGGTRWRCTLPDGRTGIAGWMWHPLSLAEIYDLCRALQQPRVLDAIPRENPWTQATGVVDLLRYREGAGEWRPEG